MSKIKLLVCDPYKEELFKIRQALRKSNNYQLSIAGDPENIEAMLQTQLFSIVIISSYLRIDQCRQIINLCQKYSPHATRLLIAAGSLAKKVSTELQNGNFHFFLMKPWKPSELRIVLQNASLFNSVIQNKANELEAKRIQFKRSNVARRLEDEKERFIAVANHELRTPATIITSALDVLKSESDKLDHDQEQMLNIARGGIQRLNEIIKTFSILLRNQSDGLSSFYQSINVSEMLNSVSMALSSALVQRNVTYKIESDQNLTTYGNTKTLYRVFENLIGNAIKYTPNGGQITVKAKQELSTILVSVHDNGIGIPKNELNNIFKMFYQRGDILKHHSSSHEFLGGGLGLGLSLCKSIVEGHLGEIWAESPDNEPGSIFYVRLPGMRQRQSRMNIPHRLNTITSTASAWSDKEDERNIRHEVSKQINHFEKE